MNIQERVVTPFALKHFQPDISVALKLIHVSKFTDLKQENLSWAAIETPNDIVNPLNIKPGGLIIYPGRHPEDKHNLVTLAKRDITLYKLEDSPWNIATADHAIALHQALSLQTISSMPVLYPELTLLEEYKISRTENPIIGVLGAGSVGKRVIERSLKSGHDVLYSSRHEQPHIANLGAQHVAMTELFSLSDVVIIALPKTDETYHLINRNLIKKLKDSAELISISSPGVLHETEIIDAMQHSHIRVGLDTLEHESLGGIGGSAFNPHTNPLVQSYFKSGRLLLTPHIGYKTSNSTTQLVEAISRPLISIDHTTPYPNHISTKLVTSDYQFPLIKVISND